MVPEPSPRMSNFATMPDNRLFALASTLLSDAIALWRCGERAREVNRNSVSFGAVRRYVVRKLAKQRVGTERFASTGRGNVWVVGL